MGCGGSTGGGSVPGPQEIARKGRLARFDGKRDFSKIEFTQAQQPATPGFWMSTEISGRKWWNECPHSNWMPMTIFVAESTMFFFNNDGSPVRENLWDVFEPHPAFIFEFERACGPKDAIRCCSYEKNMRSPKYPEWLAGNTQVFLHFTTGDGALDAKLAKLMCGATQVTNEWSKYLDGPNDLSLDAPAFVSLDAKQQEEAKAKIAEVRAQIESNLWKHKDGKALQAQLDTIGTQMRDFASGLRSGAARNNATMSWMNDHRMGLEERGLELGKYSGIMARLQAALQEFSGDAKDLDAHMDRAVLEQPAARLIMLAHSAAKSKGTKWSNLPAEEKSAVAAKAAEVQTFLDKDAANLTDAACKPQFEAFNAFLLEAEAKSTCMGRIQALASSCEGLVKRVEDKAADAPEAADTIKGLQAVVGMCKAACTSDYTAGGFKDEDWLRSKMDSLNKEVAGLKKTVSKIAGGWSDEHLWLAMQCLACNKCRDKVKKNNCNKCGNKFSDGGSRHVYMCYCSTCFNKGSAPDGIAGGDRHRLCGMCNEFLVPDRNLGRRIPVCPQCVSFCGWKDRCLDKGCGMWCHTHKEDARECADKWYEDGGCGDDKVFMDELEGRW